AAGVALEAATRRQVDAEANEVERAHGGVARPRSVGPELDGAAAVAFHRYGYAGIGDRQARDVAVAGRHRQHHRWRLGERERVVHAEEAAADAGAVVVVVDDGPRDRVLTVCQGSRVEVEDAERTADAGVAGGREERCQVRT